jgi:predicted nucleotidyltransferase
MNNEEKILEVLFEDSYREYHIRLLAKLTKLNPNTIINITGKLEKEGLIKKTKDKDTNRVLIKSNTQNRIFILKKKFYNITKILNSGLIDYLEQELSFPTVVLFGGYAKAENHLKSDLDLFIISDVKKELNLERFEKKMGTEIQVFLNNKKDFQRMKLINKELINNVINGYVLTGYLEVL